MPIREKILENQMLKSRVDQLFFPEGKKDNQAIGFELEVWPFRHGEKQNELVPFFNDQETGLIQILQSLQGSVDGLEWEPTADGLSRFKIADGGQLTFEPGGQLEYSGAPKINLVEAIQEINLVLETLRCRFKDHGIWFFHSGLNPWYTVEEVGLQLQKNRYINMNNYFQRIGPYGQKMMRLSTSLQVNLDVGDPSTAQRRWLAANLLSPIFTALFGNSPFVDGKATGAYSFRSLIWQRLDPSRTGFQEGFLASDYHPCPVRQYHDFAMNAFCMRVPDEKGEMVFDGRLHSFKDWMERGIRGYFPEMDDWTFHLSTLFPEVRARGFFEVRYLDAQSKVWCSVPGILLTHMIYDEETREEVIRLLEPYRTTLPGMVSVAATKGMTEPEIADLAKRLFQSAMHTASGREDPTILELCELFFRHYTHRNRNPATDLIELNNGSLFSPQQYRDFEKRQIESAGPVVQMICEYS